VQRQWYRHVRKQKGAEERTDSLVHCRFFLHVLSSNLACHAASRFQDRHVPCRLRVAIMALFQRSPLHQTTKTSLGSIRWFLKKTFEHLAGACVMRLLRHRQTRPLLFPHRGALKPWLLLSLFELTRQFQCHTFLEAREVVLATPSIYLLNKHLHLFFNPFCLISLYKLCFLIASYLSIRLSI
jgi:hypothetical protein